jgi:alkyl sulfatase BDS1-like metallo-beta-lactamase superfamily hydrolase
MEVMKGKPAEINSKITSGQLAQFPLDCFFSMLSVNLNSKACLDTVKSVGIRFTDEHKEFSIYIRHGVAEIRNDLPQNPDILVNATAQDFKEMLAKIRNPITTLSGFNYEKGSALSFGNVLKLFQPPVQKLAYQSL